MPFIKNGEPDWEYIASLELRLQRLGSLETLPMFIKNGAVDYEYLASLEARVQQLESPTSPTLVVRDIPAGALVLQSRSGVAAMDYATISGDLVPRTTPWSIAFRVKPDMRNGHGLGSNGAIVSKWNKVTGASGWSISRFGNGIAMYFGTGTTDAWIGIVYTADTVFSGSAEREICVSWDGTNGTPANRVKIYWRAIGGAWVAGALTFGLSPPATLPNVSEPVNIATLVSVETQNSSFELRDLRIFSSAVVPSGTDDIPLATATARWRFRRMSADRTRAIDEVVGHEMQLLNTGGGKLRPVRIIDTWTPLTPYSKRVLVFGDSKFGDSTNWPSSFRRECANQLAAIYGKNVDFVGQFTDGFAPSDFASNAQHSAMGGSLLSIGIISRCLTDVTAYNPDVVVLEGGTNDAIIDSATATVLRDRMSACIDAVLAASPTVHVIVCTDPRITPASWPLPSAELLAFNALLPALAASKGPRVTLVDLYALVSEAGQFDSLHPNSVAHLRIGEELAVAIAAVI